MKKIKNVGVAAVVLLALVAGFNIFATERTKADLTTNVFQPGQTKGVTSAGMRDLVDSAMKHSLGEVGYFDTTGSTIVLATQSDGTTNMVAVNPATTFSSNSDGFSNNGADNGYIKYTGTIDKKCHIAGTISISPTTNNDQFVLGVGKNGSVLSNCKVLQKMGATTDTQSTAFHCFTSVSTNDYFAVYSGNMTAGRNMTVKSLNLFSMCVQ